MNSGLTIGSLFSGVGGLDLAVEDTYGGRTIWHSETYKPAATVLAAHWPDIPNHGDITAINWHDVEPVDILCGGFPCQDISLAGRKAGIEGTRSGLWANMHDAIRLLRPRLAVVENVARIVSRGLNRVHDDLAAIGYDTQWISLRASDVGACHQRNRMFLTATPAGTTPPSARARPTMPHWESVRLLPTPTATYPGGTAHAYRQRLADHDGRTATFTPLNMIADWAQYGPAIDQHATLVGRPPPPPTDGSGRLSPLFVEWMMGLGAGWVTDHTLSRTAALRALGNGVVPHQAATALELLEPTGSRMQ